MAVSVLAGPTRTTGHTQQQFPDHPSLVNGFQIGLPSAFILNSYSMYGRAGLSFRMPYQFTIAGSNDGITWTTVDTQNGINTWSGQTPITFTTSSTTPWLYFRLITQAIQGNGTSYQDLNIGQWTLYSSNVLWQSDFYADRLGNLLRHQFTGQSLANWLGGATGYVATWYDQSGAGNHAVPERRRQTNLLSKKQQRDRGTRVCLTEQQTI
jgi:hypothetical protein